ncbi:hypothetical protein ACW4TU_15620 [Streptomyces sp. QTS52]
MNVRSRSGTAVAPSDAGDTSLTGRRRPVIGGRSVQPPGGVPSRGAPHRGRATAAAFLGFVAAVALAGCAVPGGSDEPLAAPPASAPSVLPSALPSAEREPEDPAGRSAPAPPPPEEVPADPAPTTATTDPTPHPTPSRTASTGSPEAALPASSPTASPSVAPRLRATPTEAPRAETPDGRSRDGSTTLRIGSWSARVVRGGQEEVDRCRDAVQWTGPDLGTTEDGFALRTAVVVGHDYCGFDRFAELPLGTVVTATTPRGTFEYRVYARHVSPGRGTPSHGLYWGDLTLQSCVGPDTGFSYLMRV